MDNPAAPKSLYFLLLSIQIVCSTGVFLSPVKDIEHQELQIQDHISHTSGRTLFTKTTMHYLVNLLRSNSPTTQVTEPLNTQTPAVITVPSGPPLSVTPPTNPVTTPDTNNPGGPPTPVVAPPAGAGQSWCVAKGGVSPASLQTALDYACGHGADCLALQQGGICYDPANLQKHASYAFNSYCLKNPGQRSCDFGGAATVTNVNPSSGSCTYPTLSSSTSPTTTPPTTTTPTPMTPTPTSGSSANPPSILSGNYPGLGDSPPTPSTSSISISRSLLHPFISCIIVVTSLITGIIVLDI